MDFYFFVIIGLLGYLVYLLISTLSSLKRLNQILGNKLENDRDVLYSVFGRKMMEEQLKIVEEGEKDYVAEKNKFYYLERAEREENKKPFPSDALKEEIKNFVHAWAKCDFQENKLNLMIEENIAVLNGNKKIKDVKSYLGGGMFFFDQIEEMDEGKKYEEILSRSFQKK
ncbi:MAG: hypothetical protein PHE49_09520 [bacterium]|nr:hypothetical protein [bacterium]